LKSRSTQSWEAGKREISPAEDSLSKTPSLAAENRETEESRK